MTANTLECAAHISSEVLSAWRDGLLSEHEMARLSTHAPDCPACRARLADFDAVSAALLRQRELEPGERIVESVRRRAARGGRGQAGRRLTFPPRPNGRLWSGLGALGAVAALLLVFVYVFGHAQGTTGGLQPTATTGANATATFGKPIVTPRPTVTPSGPFTQVASMQQAWGAHAATQSFMTQVDSTHLFWATSITPDGKSLLGYEYAISGGSPDQSVAAQAGLLDTANQHFTAIGVSQTPFYPPGCCSDDGRFLLATDSTGPGATCGLCHTRYWSYDTQTGTLWKVAVGTDFQVIQRVYLDHGLLMMWTGEGIEVADLAARRITPLAGVPASADLQFYRWPYVLYTQPAGGNQAQTLARDLTTGVTTPLPQADAINGQPFLVGDTLFVTTLTEDEQVTTLYEMDHFLSSGAQPRQIGRYLGNMDVLAANDRLVVLSGAIYDRLEGVFVSYGTASSQGAPFGSLAGTYLATFNLKGGTPGGATPQLVTIYDTSKLPQLITP
jgi:hypothetical protein